MSNLTYGNIDVDQLYLVRVQGGFEGAMVNGNDLHITRFNQNTHDSSMRNTIHFTLNGVVSNHVYSQFNDLYVLVSPLLETVQKNKGLLAGLNPSDTFFHQNSQDIVCLHQPTLIAPNGAEIPEHILNSSIRIVRYEPPYEITAEALRSTRNKAVGSVLKEFGAPENLIGMWGWADCQDPSKQERNQLLVSLGYDPDTIAKTHTGSPEANIEEYIGMYVFHHNSILDGEKLDTLITGLQIPHVEQIATVEQSILEEISKITNTDIQKKMTERFSQISQKHHNQRAQLDEEIQRYASLGLPLPDKSCKYDGPPPPPPPMP